MWFNSTQREEPYLGLKRKLIPMKVGVPQGELVQVLHGCRQLVP
jgi:hypothetical protein